MRDEFIYRFLEDGDLSGGNIEINVIRVYFIASSFVLFTKRG